ncbi:MAG TPA: hypothetical protein VGY53_09335 [Isosphaeraceae bacterium]|nr:hypothetical protein [Isosphaeraceae bacterium]
MALHGATLRLAVGQDASKGPATTSELLQAAGGRRLLGRVVGDSRSGFQFQPRDSANNPIALERGSVVEFESADPSVLAGLSPFHILLGIDQKVSGRLEAVDETEVRFESGPSGRPLRVARGGAQGLVQRPGETQVLSESFESIDTTRWAQTGQPSLAAEPRLVGEHSLRLPAGGSTLTYRVSDPVGAGRLEVGFFDTGEREPGQRWFVELTFRSPTGLEPIRAVLGWDDSWLAVLSPQGPSLAVQRLARRPGWHRLVVRFDPERTELAVDGDELAHGGSPGGPLAEVRLGTQSLGSAAPKASLAGYIDDLGLARLSEPVGGLEVDPSQDELRLTGGDQLFGHLKSADPERLLFQIDGKDAMVGWNEVAGVYFRRAPAQSEPIEGLLVRLEWRAAGGNDPRDVDRIEGALAAVSNSAFTLQTPYAGTLAISRDRLLRLEVLGRGRRVVLDPSAHHLGDEVFNKQIKLDPPQFEGPTLEVPFTLERVPPGRAFAVFDVVQVAGESDQLTNSASIKKGELRTNLFLNGRQIDYLNRHVASKNETPLRIRLPIPQGVLRTGRNMLKLEQVGTAKDPKFLDDIGVLHTALEFQADSSGPPAQEIP